MNRKVFNFGIYKDALRRTAVIGGIFTVLLTLVTLFVFLGKIVDLSHREKAEIITLGFNEIHPAIIVIPLLMVPLLAQSLFGFLNKRSTSDFWHSVPFTRECIFLSFCGAIFSWVLVTTLVSTTASVLFYAVLPQYFAINMATVFCTVLGIIAMSLLILSAFLIAMSLTGTVFNNFAVALIVLFLPRAFLFCLQALQSNSFLFDFSTRFMEDSLALNMLFGLLISSLFGNAAVDVYGSVSSQLYTYALGLVYLFVALVLFKRRKSEAAANSSINRFMQTVFRLSVSFAVCLIPLAYIIDELHSKNSGFNDNDVLTIVILYVVAIVVFFLYELISTRKAKNMLTAAPSLLILLALNVAFFCAAHFGYLAQYNYTPTPESVSKVKFTQSSYYGNDYFENAMFQIEIDDENVKKTLCDSYVQTRDSYEKNKPQNDDSYLVGFKTAFGYKYRTVYVKNDTNTALLDYVSNTDEYKELFNLEKIFDKSISMSFYNNVDYTSDYTAEDKKEIIDCFIDEVQSLKAEEWFDIVQGNQNIAENGGIINTFTAGQISGSIAKGVKTYSYDFMITNLLPKTYDLIMSKTAQKQTENGNRALVLNMLKDFSEVSEEESDMLKKNYSVNLYNGITMSNREYFNINKKDKATKLYDVLSSTDQAPTHNGRLAVLSIDFYDNVNYDYHHYSVVFKVPDDADLTFLLEKDVTTDMKY